MDDVALTLWLCDVLGEIDGWSWSADAGAEYPPGDVGVNYGRIPQAPDRGVGVRVYGGTDNSAEDTKTRRAQLRFRGPENDPRGADRLADQAKDVLHELIRVGVISEITRLSISPSTPDKSGREERTDNYLIIFETERSS